MAFTAAEALTRIRDRAGEDENSMPEARMLRFLNDGLKDYCEFTEVLWGPFCPGELHSNGLYPLTDFHNVITGNGGPDETSGPFTIFGDSIWRVYWDYWAGSSSSKRRVVERTRNEWMRWTNNETTNTSTNVPEHFLIEKRGETEYLRLYPPTLNSTLGTTGAAGATLWVYAARQHRELVSSGASLTQTTSLEVPDESIDALTMWVRSLHYGSRNMSQDEAYYKQLYEARKREDKIKYGGKMGGGSFLTTDVDEEWDALDGGGW